jgi:hypothetical protein
MCRPTPAIRSPRVRFHDHARALPRPRACASTTGATALGAERDASYAVALRSWQDLAYGSIFASLWRVKSIFRLTFGTPVRSTPLVGYVFGLMILDIIMMTCLQVTAPIFYKVNIVSRTPYGAITESYGACSAEVIAPWAAAMILHALLLVASLLLVCESPAIASSCPSVFCLFERNSCPGRKRCD